MIKTVVKELHWSLKKIDKLFLDNEDYWGLEFWYNDIFEMNEKLKKK